MSLPSYGFGIDTDVIGFVPAYGLGRLEIEAPAPFTPEPVHPPGMGRGEIRKRIIEEDEMILAVIMAFLHIKDE